MNSTKSPLFSWIGGKRRLLPEILPLIPPLEGHRYYEPFVGVGSVFLALQPDEATISDLNFELMNFYTVVQKSPDFLIGKLKCMEQEDYNSPEYYYRMGALDRDSVVYERMSYVEKAARFFYLTKSCFKHRYRVNSKGFFNVPFGEGKVNNLCDDAEIRELHEHLNPLFVRLSLCDFEKVAMDARRGDFVYFDPPYDKEGGHGFTEDCCGGFSKQEQKRLSNCVIRLSSRGVKCLLSSSDTPFIRELFGNKFLFHIKEIECERAISAGTSGDLKVKEMLIYNYTPPKNTEVVDGGKDTDTVKKNT
jgi:DNA adenine methylase